MTYAITFRPHRPEHADRVVLADATRAVLDLATARETSVEELEDGSADRSQPRARSEVFSPSLECWVGKLELEIEARGYSLILLHHLGNSVPELAV